ncbi:MAG TPA: hypothetical protein VJQ09_05025, partial [Candidatus Limnocylindria bacterium]|nr:hypothetical protein [Candidatus Limnocylindria bacterium]
MNRRTLILSLHWLAIACSAAHSVGDALLISVLSAPAAVVYVVLGVGAFTWWLYSLSRLARSDFRSGAWGAAAMALLWGALANGATVVFCMPPCAAGAWADVIHVGSLVFGLAAAAVTAP